MEFQFHLWPPEKYPDVHAMAEVARVGESLGYTSVACGEHILVPDGKESDVITHRYYELMVLFTYLAAATTRLRLQMCALVVPYRHPGLCARSLASIDQVSDGRLEVVVGSGWSADEFRALGVPFTERGAITDEYVRVMQILWTESSPAFRGRFVDFEPTTFEPKCAQRPHVPLWIGGSGPVARRRFIEYGVGWAPMGTDEETLASTIREWTEGVESSGRDATALGFMAGLTYLKVDPYSEVAAKEVSHRSGPGNVGGSSDEAIEIVRRYAEAGVTRVQVGSAWQTPKQYVEWLQQFAEEVMPAVAGI